MAEMWVDVDTAITVPVNVYPLTDDTDFKTRETAVAYNAAGMDLVWNFQTAAGVTSQTAVTPTTAGVYDWTHSGDGMYKIEIPASGGGSINNDTEGFGWFTGVATGVLPWRGPIIGFRAAGLNDALIDSAYSTTRGLAGTALPNAAADAAGGLAISDAGGLDLDTKLGYLTAAVATATALATAQTDLDTITGADGVTLATAQGNYAPSKAGDSMALTAAAVDAVWDEPIAGHLTAGTTGLSEVLGSSALVDSTITGTPTSTTFDFTGGSTVNGFYNDQLVYILSGTGIGQVRPIETSAYSGGTTTITVDEVFKVTPAASDRFAILVSHVHPKSQITADIDANSTQLAAILADTASIGITKNAAFSNLEFLMVDATDHVTPETGLTVTGQRSIDGGAFASISGTIAEVSNGIYQVDLLAADTNGDVITYKFSATGAADRFVTIKTRA